MVYAFTNLYYTYNYKSGVYACQHNCQERGFDVYFYAIANMSNGRLGGNGFGISLRQTR